MRWTRPLCLVVLAVSTASLARPIDETPPSLPEPATVPATPAPELVPAEACLPIPEDAADDAADDAAGDDVDDTDSNGDRNDGEEDADAARADTSVEDEGLLYSKDISDAELRRMWSTDLESLGSMSIGLANAGRLINGVQFPKNGGNWSVVDPQETWGTRETVTALMAAITEVSERLPNSPPLRVNDISKKDGGWHRPHRSHQNGRDVDLGFYYPNGETVRIKKRETCIDLARNWALIRALITKGDVQTILVDKRVQAVLHGYARSIGEDPVWLDEIFRGSAPILNHAPRHRDHFHVRFYNPRAQELGRRVQPLLAERPEHNVVTYRVKRGDTLGRIARVFGTTAKLIEKQNKVRSNSLKVGRTLTIPLRGPCTNCPLPPPVVVPARRLPPGFEEGVFVLRPMPTTVGRGRYQHSIDSRAAVARVAGWSPSSQSACGR
jgi:LysM repeat protein/murein endopeptidase